MNARGLDLYIDVGKAADGELDELIGKVIRLPAERRAGLHKWRGEATTKSSAPSTLKPVEV